MAPATATATDLPTSVTQYPQIDIDAIEFSGLNPRTHWDTESDRQLQESITKEGVLEPILVRPHPKKENRYQVVAGERRFKAAKAIGFGLIPAIVRELSDERVIELALTENIQRRNMHPLDEAHGFVKRLEMGGSSPEQLATALGLSRTYVADRIRLTKLVPAATKLLETGEMPVSYAIVLAKLEPKVQEQALKECVDYRFDFETNKNREFLTSVGELKEWIADNVRLNVTAPEVQEEFPEVAEEVTAAAAKGATVVMLSEHRTPYQHKSKPDDPLFADKWEVCKKTDKAAQTGIIVEGRRRGERVYFKPVVPKPAQRSSTSTMPPSPAQSPAAKLKADEAAKRQRAADNRRRDLERRWQSAKKLATKAIADHVAKLPVNKLVPAVARTLYGADVKKARTPDELVRALALQEATMGDNFLDSLHTHAKAFGFDVKQWFADHVKAQRTEQTSKVKKAKKR